jgi:hypothetical protein
MSAAASHKSAKTTSPALMAVRSSELFGVLIGLDSTFKPHRDHASGKHVRLKLRPCCHLPLCLKSAEIANGTRLRRTTKLTDSHERRRTPGICKHAKPGAHGCSV